MIFLTIDDYVLDNLLLRVLIPPNLREILPPVELMMFQLQWFISFFLHKLRQLHQDTTDAMGVPEWLPFAAGLILGGAKLAALVRWKIFMKDSLQTCPKAL